MISESKKTETEGTAPSPAGSQSEAKPVSYRSGIVGALLSLLDLRRTHFGAHCRRVAEWSGEMGRLGGLSSSELEELDTAALLHDVGFIVASGDRLFAEPERDRGGTRPTHDLVGYSILNEIPGFENIAEAVLHHHEHYDGTGRPMGLKGVRIPVMSRIIAVADAYDIEIHPGLGMLAADEETARRSLMRQRERRLDPDLVNRLFFVIANLDPIRRKGTEEFEITPTALTPGMVLSRDLRTLDNLLLLKANTILTQDFINRLLASEKLDWLLAKAYVNARSIREEELPLEERKPEFVMTTAGAPLEGRARSTILVVDDSKAICNAIRRELGREGIEAVGVTDVESAVKLLDTQRFDAAITDIVMAGADGFAFLSEVKAKHPDLHVVVLSGFPSAENIHALRGFQNVVRFVTKPWSGRILLSSVEEAMDLTKAAAKK